jgi:hypothetical protein
MGLQGKSDGLTPISPRCCPRYPTRALNTWSWGRLRLQSTAALVQRVILISGSARRVKLPRASEEALQLFGAPLDELTLPDLQSPDVVFQIGLPPKRIDILTSITGVEFEDAWTDRVIARVGALNVPTIGKDQLIRNKRATRRPRDLTDVQELERMS